MNAILQRRIPYTTTVQIWQNCVNYFFNYWHRPFLCSEFQLHLSKTVVSCIGVCLVSPNLKKIAWWGFGVLHKLQRQWQLLHMARCSRCPTDQKGNCIWVIHWRILGHLNVTKPILDKLGEGREIRVCNRRKRKQEEWPKACQLLVMEYLQLLGYPES
jgi:hypothetical protein